MTQQWPDAKVLENVDQLKALADPLRQRILEVLFRAPATTKQVAEQLNEKPTKLYHHVDVLAEAGLIDLVETRQNRGTVEKYYRAAARQFVIDRDLLTIPEVRAQVQGQLHGMVVDTLQEGLADATQHFRTFQEPQGTGHLHVTLAHQRARLTIDQMRALSEKLTEWLDELQAAHNPDESIEYAATVAFFPVERGSGEEDSD